MFIRRCLLLSLVTLLTSVPALAALPALSGQWSLLPDESDDPAAELKGLAVIRRMPRAQVDQTGAGPGQSTQDRYWEQQDMMAERRAFKAVPDVGAIQRLLDATKLTIAQQGDTVSIDYDAKLARSFKPTEGGPSYSAKGTEYTTDSIGEGLSYYRDGKLVVETILAPRGRMVETYQLDASSHRLTLKVELKNPDWLITARIKRVFSVAGSH
jgi:hypothetical protein